MNYLIHKMECLGENIWLNKQEKKVFIKNKVFEYKDYNIDNDFLILKIGKTSYIYAHYSSNKSFRFDMLAESTWGCLKDGTFYLKNNILLYFPNKDLCVDMTIGNTVNMSKIEFFHILSSFLLCSIQG